VAESTFGMADFVHTMVVYTTMPSITTHATNSSTCDIFDK
jgi:hypothetical protein